MSLVAGRRNQKNGMKSDLIIPSTKQLQQQALGHPLSNSVSGSSNASRSNYSQTLRKQQKLKGKKRMSSDGGGIVMKSGISSQMIHPHSLSLSSLHDSEYDDSILDPTEDAMIVLRGERSDDIIYQHIGYGKGDAYNFENILEDEDDTINCLKKQNDDESKSKHKNDKQIRQNETIGNIPFLPFPIPCLERPVSPLLHEEQDKVDLIQREKVKVGQGRHTCNEINSTINNKAVVTIQPQSRHRECIALDEYTWDNNDENQTDEDDEGISLLRGDPVSSINCYNSNHRTNKISMTTVNKIFGGFRVKQSNDAGNDCHKNTLTVNDCPEKSKKVSSSSSYWMTIPNKDDGTDDSTTKDSSSSDSSISNGTADRKMKKKSIAFDMGYLVDVPCQYVTISDGSWEYVNEYFAFTSSLYDDDDEGTRIVL